MKRIFTLLALVLSGASAWAAAMTDDGHTLTELWARYQAACKADRPQLELEILGQIKQQATAERLPVDFYDAATAYVSTVQRRDWKQREAALETLEKEVAALDEPIVTFLWLTDYRQAATDAIWAYVQENIGRFQGRNPAFYRSIAGFLGGNLAPFIGSDKEYVLWRMLLRRQYQEIEEDEIYRALRDQVQGKYPAQPALEYYALETRYRMAGQEQEREHALEELAARYEGKAVSLYPRGALLQLRKRRLDGQEGGSEAYRQLYQECEAFERQRKAFRGEEALILKNYSAVRNLERQLTAQGLEVEASREWVKVSFQNLRQATLVLYRGTASDGKKLKSWALSNPAGSFYVKDTVQVAMPALPDGTYQLVVSQGKVESHAPYNQYTLSVATRSTADLWQAYVTDYRSGEPLRKVKLSLYKGDKLLSSTTLAQNGFTTLPKAFQKAIGTQAYYTLVAESGDRSSGAVGLRGISSYRDDPLTGCNIYRDRGAYNPGDTLQYKLVLYRGDAREGYAVCEAEDLMVTLLDPEGNQLEQQTLRTNAFGSASGSFTLPRGLRNGNFSLQVSRKGESGLLAQDRFRVDEFVLPSFSLSWDQDGQLYLVGDQVPVGGSLASYSGHSLAGARVSARVTRWNQVVLEQEQVLGPDNRFRFTYPALEAGLYRTEITVTDATGEMQAFGSHKYIGDRIGVSVQVRDAADGSFVPARKAVQAAPLVHASSGHQYLIAGDSLRASLEVADAEGGRIPLPLSYALLDGEDRPVREGTVDSGTEVTLDLTDLPSGLYTLSAWASVPARDGLTELRDQARCSILLQRPDEGTLTPAVKRFCLSGPATVADGRVSVRLGSNFGPVWGVATLFGEDRKVLEDKVFKLEQGVPGTLSFAYADAYPDAVRLQVFYFQDGEAVCFDRQYRRAKDKLSLPLSFSRFTSRAYPGAEYRFTLRTASGVEALAGVWDKSLDAVAPNSWPVVSLGDYSVPAVFISSACGHVTGEDGPDFPLWPGNIRMLSKAAGVVTDDALVLEESAMDLEASAMALEASAPDQGEPAVRSFFSSALTFQPHLEPGPDGTLEFSFRTSDKLSTYYVAVYAHGKDMRNALTRQEMMVSLPVKVSLAAPSFLYVGDRYQAALTVSSSSDQPVSGRLRLRYAGSLQEIPVTVPAGGTVSHRFLVQVPGPEGSLTLTASFLADEFSDAVEVEVPVYPAAQVLTESHSGVLRAGMDRETLLQELRSRFVNVPGSEAALQEITVLDKVKEALPSHVEPSGRDVLSLSEAWYVQQLSQSLCHSDCHSDCQSDCHSDCHSERSEESLLPQILACQNQDGGFGWFQGMNSSALITAVLLERFAKLRSRGFQVPDLVRAVQFLDKTQFGTSFPVWRGWVSDQQYMYVRALYPEVPFTVKAVSKADKKRMSAFQKEAKAYLLPSGQDGRGLQGQILAKARRLLTLRSLAGSSEGLALSGAWGVTLDPSRLSQSRQADLASLVEYAVEHRDGGWYFPNAVLPWRGLLESEAYAHALLCNLLSAEGREPLADGIRLWLMLQKETQQWEADPAFVDAITAILDGSQAVLDTRVLALSASFQASFHDIRSSGNGFTIDRTFYREVTQEQVYDNTTRPQNVQVSVREEIQPGDPVQVGDRILVEYRIWNAENRSFVKLDAAREAALRPVEQLSGPIGLGLVRPVRSGYSFGFVPQGYRNVKAARTEYYFDSYPEETTTLCEEFFVTQSGAFTAPVVTIESLYAPHYRAVTASRGVLTVTAPAP